MESKLFRILFFTSVILVILSFNLQHNPTSGWQKKQLPYLNNTPISDIIYIDSLNGWAVAFGNLLNDTGYVIRTSDGGENWIINIQDIKDFTRVVFLNASTGYVSGYNLIYKTSDAGQSWNSVSLPGSFFM